MHTQFVRRSLVALLVALLLAVIAQPVGPALAGGSIGPRAMLLAYYDLINSRDYWTAYQQWDNPPQTYADFAAGYADTVRVTAYFGGLQATDSYRAEGCIPGILIGQRTDGSQVAYQGSYDVRYNPPVTGVAQWKIIAGSFVPLPTVPTDPGQIMRDYLDVICIEHGSGIEPPVSISLADYISAVNRGDFADAYGYWLHPAGSGYQPPQTFAEFANGWSDTTETVLLYGQLQNAASPYTVETHRIPVVMLGYHTDGSVVMAYGCLGLSYYAAQDVNYRWRLYAGYLQPVTLGAPVTLAQIEAMLGARCY